jgi:Mat/Ecp fimbriae periplasmic chaperone
MIRFKWIALFLAIFTPAASAVTIYGLTTKILSDKNNVIQKIANSDEESAHMITVKVDRIDSPETMNIIKAESEGELLFTPAKTLLSPKMETEIKFFYKGPDDSKERYYRLRWVDEVIAQGAQGDKKNVQVDARAVVDTILMVAPRKINYAYEFKDNTLFNKGNSTLFIAGYGACKEPTKKAESCKVVRPIMPGKQIIFSKLDLNGSDGYLGFWQGEQFVPIDLKTKQP